MAVDLCYSYEQVQEEEEEDEYIDMEVSSYYNLLKSSPIHQQNEFEFHTQSGPLSKDHLSLTSPADELFYNGKLLPLHLPPRLQIMATLLQNHYPSNDHKEFYSTPLSTNATCTPVAVTPFLSCNASPVESCQVSKELNPEEYFLECGGGECRNSKKLSWTKKLKLIRQTSALGSKIKASRAYLKYLFGKSKTCSENKITTQESLGKESMTAKDDKICHRRSFSGAFAMANTMALKALTSSGSSSSSSSSSSSNSNETQLFKRSSSANLDIENAIAGAIAHCKQSQSQELRSRKTLSEINDCSF